MGSKRVNRGPVSDRVAANVKVLRKLRGLSLSELAGRMRSLGMGMAATGISKVELGNRPGGRRVDVDDLVALALALDVTPSRLLLTEDAGTEACPLTPNVNTDGETAWNWTEGVEITPEWLGSPDQLDRFRSVRFRLENRPQDPASISALHFGGVNMDATEDDKIGYARAQLTAAIRQLEEQGVSAGVVATVLSLLADAARRQERVARRGPGYWSVEQDEVSE